ncbi:type III secretion system export apparatus subunit SctU [Dyella acidisoli]|uniref:EscU/YscU/HrcU family type III secretion system export apparatus switch protein n=1 Tax=Dyella acidisoli TaxID=1867834 RepID=A0ABQ5XVS6_9GAMM|nr:type III secretion system export apparatus subunit SctU [Dyella acidisoli]GLQ95581.1 EscU/YscU/HrcU family type III secretion system export apparatus switch protein [Dyella acidisoli]
MAEQNKDSGDRTEKPTAKRLRDARRDGDVPKSRELTSTVVVLAWLLMVMMGMPLIHTRLNELFDTVLQGLHQPFDRALHNVGWAACIAFLWLTVPLLLGAMAISAMVEFLQVGPVFAPKKFKPDLSRMNPTSGIAKLFSQENLIEVIKALAKSALLIGLFVWLLFALIGQFVKLPYAPPEGMGDALWIAVKRFATGVIFVFFFVSALDVFYQRYAFTKKMKMSRREIKQELKENEGDPMIKSRRRQLHQEWSQQNTLASVRKASVVVTNPTHLAIAIRYEQGEDDLPVIVAKGEDHEAALIRQAAEEAGVPMMRNVSLARSLYENVEVDEYLPGDFFEAVAELLRWAESIRASRDGK